MPKNLSLRQLTVLIISVILLAVAFHLSSVNHVAQKLTRFPTSTLLLIMGVMTANLLLVSFRFWRQLAHLGIEVSWNIALRASLAGYAASLVMISLFGQVAGRQAILQNAGVSPVVNASLAGYERALLAIISASLALCGGIYLFGEAVVVNFFGHMALSEIAVVAAVGGVLSFWLGMSRFEKRISNQIASKKNLVRVLQISGLTLTGQLMMLGCFVLGMLAIRPDLPLLSLLAASAVISFAASLPITVSGWGLRELAAVFLFGKLGVSAPDAMAVSITVGLCSILPIIATIPFITKQPVEKSKGGPTLVKTQNIQEIEKMAAWMLGMATAVTIFFQFHAGLPGGGVINLNLADPFAILALAAVSLHCLFSRQLPLWRVSHFNIALGLISVLFVSGFLHGWMNIGLTQWALGARLIGWLILLGYVSAGYLIASTAGTHGLRRFSETLLATAAAVIVFQAVMRQLSSWGFLQDIPLTPNFEGYAGNRNAFAFQLLASLTLSLSFTRIYARYPAIFQARQMRYWMIALLLGVLMTGLVWTGSRAGMLTGGAMLVIATYRNLTDRKMLARGLLFTVLIWSVFWLANQIRFPNDQTLTSHSTFPSSPAVQAQLSTEFSNQERISTWNHGIELWRQAPFFGAGLGVFYTKSVAWFGYNQVIHSTPIWILAEFGLVGLCLVGWIFFQVTRYAFQKKSPQLIRHALLLLLFSFALFSAVHEIFYQRIFWLILGALLASPFHSQSRR